jgi:Predicted periplasmic ligand-binding sensor domain
MSGIHKGLILFILSIQISSVFSQIAPGEWRTHFSYRSANQVVYANEKIYVQASNKLYSYSNKGEIQTYSTLTGLNGHQVSFIGWCDTAKTLVVVYADGNIDLLTESGIVNLSDFKDKSITADKTVYSLRIKDGKAYLSTGIGLLVVDIVRREISETYSLNFSSTNSTVYDAALWNDSVAVVTNLGIYTGSCSKNLQDASNWSEKGFLADIKPAQIVRFGDKFYVMAKTGVVYRQNNSGWEKFVDDGNVTRILVDNDYLVICAGNRTYMYDTSLQTLDIPFIESKDVAIDLTHNLFYFASGNNGVTKLFKSGLKISLMEKSIMANGPVANTAWNGFFRNGIYYCTTGGRWADRYWYPGNIMVFKDESWSSLTNEQDLLQKTGISPLDFMNLAIDPRDDGHFYITSWGEGLYEFRDSVLYKLWTNKNSPLYCVLSPESSRFVRIDGASFDADNNLWMLNSFAEDPLKILKADGTWFTPHYASMPNCPTWNSILFTSGKQVWMNSLRATYGLFVLDNRGTLEDTSDDQIRWFSSFTDQDGNVLSPYTVDCVTEDLNGAIWIGTVYGPLVATNPSNIFNSNYTFTRIKIPRNDGTENADYLLNDVHIKCIAVDGGNRKWIGTDGNGVYVLSADGLKTIYHFSTENSPLPSDYIWSIAINPNTGEAFIGTDAGLVSYRSEATQGAASYSNIHVFPNPVKPEHVGNITVTGLMENTQVKITDLSGNVLVSGISLGGQFAWNGCTSRGKKAASGVYLVFCVSEDGMEYQACKFMIVN